jgi:hypothetical protein
MDPIARGPVLSSILFIPRKFSFFYILATNPQYQRGAGDVEASLNSTGIQIKIFSCLDVTV